MEIPHSTCKKHSVYKGFGKGGTLADTSLIPPSYLPLGNSCKVISKWIVIFVSKCAKFLIMRAFLLAGGQKIFLSPARTIFPLKAHNFFP